MNYPGASSGEFFLIHDWRIMIPGRQAFIHFARETGLLPLLDYARFHAMTWRNRKRRAAFISANPAVVLPPDAMIYETCGKIDYEKYYHDGCDTAGYLIEIFCRHYDLTGASICEWGCGPGRLIRHMKNLLNDNNAVLFGVDYNRAMIEWASSNIAGIKFAVNDLHPPLPFEEESFDIIYSISVMTHLSDALQKEWLTECLRVLKPGGICLMTVHGDSFYGNLLPDEKRLYDEKGCLIRGNIDEGRKNFSAFNSSAYMRNMLLKDCSIVEHIPGTEPRQQDIWIVMKP